MAENDGHIGNDAQRGLDRAE